MSGDRTVPQCQHDIVTMTITMTMKKHDDDGDDDDDDDDNYDDYIYIQVIYIWKNGLSEKCGIPNALCHHFAHSN